MIVAAEQKDLFVRYATLLSPVMLLFLPLLHDFFSIDAPNTIDA